MEVDFLIVVLLLASFLLGMLRGAVRQLIAFGAWFVTFVVAAYARAPIGNWLMQDNPTYSQAHAEMLGFLISFIVLFAIALTFVEVSGTTIHLTNRAIVDEIVGGLVMVGVALLFVASVVIILETYYAAGPLPAEPQAGLARDLYAALERSAIVQQMHNTLIPVMLTLLTPLLPANVNQGG